MENQTLILFIAVSAAVLAVVALGGILVLLQIKRNLVRRILLERCSREGVAFVIEPGSGFRTESEEYSWFGKKQGIVCLTEYELIFIPLLGSSVIKVPAQDIETYVQLEDDPDTWVVNTKDNGIYRISAR